MMRMMTMDHGSRKMTHFHLRVDPYGVNKICDIWTRDILRHPTFQHKCLPLLIAKGAIHVQYSLYDYIGDVVEL